MILYGLQQQQYQLEAKPFSSGGEGDVYGVIGMTDKVIKVYHADRITSELEQKLNTMAKRPPSSRVLSQVAWPLDVVYDQNNHFCGFVMPRLSITAELSEIYVYPPKTNITYQQKLILAQNICVVISEVHKAGYVFGDFNPRNIGVNTNTGTVAFLDTDSYHIVVDKANNKTFRCNVCAPGYAAPELLEKCAQHVSQHPEDSKRAYAAAPLDTFTKETDNFALAIHMFKLLMNGYTPFGGIKETESASVGSPGVGDAAVRRDSYCFKPGNKPQAAAILPLETLPQEIADLFTRAFMYGRIDPKQRPSALEWHKALTNYENSLKKCSKNPTHMYLNTLHSCPWCEADDRYAVSITPSISQKGFQTPVSPTTPVNRPPVITPPSSGASGSGSYMGATGSNAAATGGSTYRAPVRPAPAPPTFFQKYKGWIIAAAVVLVFILLVKSCSGSSTPKSSVEILTGDSTVTVGETVQIRIRSTTSRVTANYDSDTISIDWGSTQQHSGGYYLIYANVTGLSTGSSTLKIYLTGNESAYDTVAISVKSSSSSSTPKSSVEILTGDSTVTVGETVQIRIRSTTSRVTANYDSDTISIDWGSTQQHSGGYYLIYANVTGLSTGSSTLKIYLTGNESVYDTIAISVKSSSTGTQTPSNSGDNEEQPQNSNGSQSVIDTNDGSSVTRAKILTANTAISGSLETSNDVMWYVLTLDEPGTVTFNMKYPQQDYSYSYWELYVYTKDNSSNSIMSSSYSGRSSDFSNSVESDSQLLGLDAGTYYVKITYGSYYSSATYTLTAVYSATEQCEMEPNGSYWTVSTLLPNIAYTGSLSSSSDVDWYVINLETSGILSFNMQYSEREYSYSYWELYVYTGDNSSNLIMSYSYAGRVSGFSDSISVDSQLLGLDAGRYYIKITHGSYHSSTTYTLTANFTATTQCEMEPNGSYWMASTLLPNIAYTGNLSSSSDVDWYVINLETSGILSFNMQYSEREYSYSYWELYVYTGDDIIMSYSYAGRVSGFSDSISVDSQLLGLDAGRYYIKITDGSYHSSTTYTLTANFTATTQCEMEPNGSYWTASTLLPNIAYTGSLSSSSDVDWYVLVLDGSATVSFNMQYSEREYSYSYWELYLYSDSNSSRSILSCSYSGKQTNSTSDQITLNAGTYYVIITDGSYHSTTPYTLTVKR